MIGKGQLHWPPLALEVDDACGNHLHLYCGTGLGEVGPQLEMWENWDKGKTRVENKKRTRY